MALVGDTDVRRLRLATGARRPPIEGRTPALYVMVTSDGLAAKVGALESSANAEKRLRRVDAAHRVREPASSPIRLAVVVELEDLPIAGDHDADSEERWAEVEHLESALRLVLARRLGRVSRWTDWIQLDRSLESDAWVAAVEAGWLEVCQLGRG